MYLGGQLVSWVGRPSFWRPGTKRPADFPLVPERVEDPAQTPAVLIGHLGRYTGASRQRLREHRVRVVCHEQGPAGRAADFHLG